MFKPNPEPIPRKNPDPEQKIKKTAKKSKPKLLINEHELWWDNLRFNQV